jgi:hypothetical protein
VIVAVRFEAVVAAAFRPAFFSCEIQTAAALLLSVKQNRPPEGGRYKIVLSPRAREAGLFPELLPVPHAGSFVQDAVAELVREH